MMATMIMLMKVIAQELDEKSENHAIKFILN